MVKQRYLQSHGIQKVYQLLHLKEKSRQMETVRNGMMDVHGEGHHDLHSCRFVLAPGDDRRKKFPLIKHMEVKVLVF